MRTKFLYIFLLIASTTYAQFPFNGLVAAYEFQNGAVLSDGAAGVNLTQTGTALTEVTNRFGDATTSAIALNGDYLNRPNIDFTGTGESLSYSFWIKTSYTGTDRQIIIDDSDRTNVTSGGWNGFSVSVENASVRLEVRSTLFYLSQNQPFSFGHNLAGLTDGEWHHISFDIQTILTTVSPNRRNINVVINIYADGELKRAYSAQPNTDTFATNIIQSHDVNTPIYIANISNESLTSTNRFDGIIDDLLIYNRVLTASEVQSIASFGDFCFAPKPSDISATNITNTGADITLSDPGTYDVAYHKTSEPFSTAIIIPNVTTGTTTLSNLEEFVDYNVYARKICTGNTTPWSQPQTFKTTRTLGRIYVNPNATGNNNGVSWQNAYVNLYDALDFEQANEEIWVAAGTYTPRPNSRNNGFRPESGVKIYGGFAGTETAINQRVYGANETILSGDLLGNDDANITFNNTSRNDNSYQVVQIFNFTNNIVLDRLTITGGHANSGGSQKSGGGVSIGDFSVGITIKDCKITKNVAHASGGAIIRIMSNSLQGVLNIEGCEFSENLSRNGGAIYSYTNANTNLNINISNSLFSSNRTENNGANLATSGSSMWIRAFGNNSTINLNLVNNTFVKNIDLGTSNSLNNFNRATVGLSESGTGRTVNATVSNNIFYENETTGGVTARSITGLYETLPASITVSNSIDEQNFSAIPSGSKTNTSNANPLFTDVANDDFSLMSGSPAIDTGDNSAIIGTTDVLGNQRIANSVVDMGAYEFGSSVLSVSEVVLSANQFVLYPNPASSFIHIQTNTTVKDVVIYNMIGKEVLRSDFTKIDISNLSKGMYVIKITSEQGNEMVKRFIKQ